MFKGDDFMFLSAYLMFLVVVSMCYWGCFMFSYLSNYDFFQNMIWNDLLSYMYRNQSWISMQIALKLICEPSSY